MMIAATTMLGWLLVATAAAQAGATRLPQDIALWNYFTDQGATQVQDTSANLITASGIGAWLLAEPAGFSGGRKHLALQGCARNALCSA